MKKKEIVYKNEMLKIYHQILEWVFPRRCPVCDDIVNPKGSVICISCKKSLVYIEEPICQKCGKELISMEQEYCLDCTRRPHNFQQGLALFRYESIVSSLYRFKYQGRVEYAEFYGRELARCYGSEIRRWEIDGIIPVPIHKSRKQIRGFNQAEEIAMVVGRALDLKVYSNIVIRCKKTMPLKELNYEERQKKLKNAFKIIENDVKLKAVLIIDDIYTTGNTIDAISIELNKITAAKKYYIAISIGDGF